MANAAWAEVQLKEVCDLTVGHVGPMASEYVEKGIPFLRSQNITPYGLRAENLKFITREFHQKLKKSALKPGDVVVVRTGYPGTALVVPTRVPEANCADLVIIRPSEVVNPAFVASYFNSPVGKARVAGSTVGVAQQHFNVTVAKEIAIPLPPRSTQDKIAVILAAYDDLIENNTRRIATLERIAQAIYMEWFVNFRFPGHENVEMVGSELGPLPEGWTLKAMKEVAHVVDCLHDRKPPRAYSTGLVLLHVWNVGSHGRLELSEKFEVEEEVYTYWTKRIEVHGGDCIITKTGRVGAVAQIPRNVRAALGRNLVAIRWEKAPTYLLRYLLSTHKEDEVSRLKSSGTIMESLHVKAIERLKVALPPDDILLAFERTGRPLARLIENLVAQNGFLRRTRDLLLPRLISGQIDVSDLDIDTSVLAA